MPGERAGEEVLPEKLGRGMLLTSQNPYPIYGKKNCDIPYPIYNLTKNLKPYLLPVSDVNVISSLVQTNIQLP